MQKKQNDIDYHLNRSVSMEEPNGLDDIIFSAIPTSLEWYFYRVKVILYLPLNCAKHNITRCNPNITVQQYKLAKGKYNWKKTSEDVFFLVPETGIEPVRLLTVAGF